MFLYYFILQVNIVVLLLVFEQFLDKVFDSLVYDLICQLVVILMGCFVCYLDKDDFKVWFLQKGYYEIIYIFFICGYFYFLKVNFFL